MAKGEGRLFVVSGPSGAGKGTVCDRIKGIFPDIVFSVSATTRKPRQCEKHGEQYFFLSTEEFSEMIEKNEFLEYDKHFDNFYGTPKKFVTDKLSEGKDVLLEIDVSGALQVKKNYNHCKMIFIVPPSLEELTRRLKMRNSETDDEIKSRLARVEREMSELKTFDYVVVNDDLDKAVAQVAEIFCNGRNV